MRTRFITCFGTCLLTLLCLSVRAIAKVPSPEQMRQDLAMLYATSPADPKLAHEHPLADRVAHLAVNQGRFLASTLHGWDQDERALLLTDGNHGEHGIRPNAHFALAMAALYRGAPDAFDDGFTAEQGRDKAIATLRFILPTHGAGGELCTDGKQWRNQWQSALWAHRAGAAAWLLWDELDPELQWLAARMICDEADRFIDQAPPTQIEIDTKAEENAWNSQVVALAYNMFPDHPQNEQWRETAIRWSLSALATRQDAESDQIVDGRPLNQWLTGANLHDDYTLENHHRVHPDYMATLRANLFQQFLYDWGGNPAPQSIRFNVDKVYASLKKMEMPDGGHLYPNGQDWRLHRNADWVDQNLGVAVWFDDPQAARLARISLETIERMAARNENGSIYQRHEYHFPSTQQNLFEGLALSYLLIRAYAPGPEPVKEADLWKALHGVHLFDAGKFGLARTEKGIASFSWGRQIMGMALPFQEDLMLAPHERGLIGHVRAAGGDREQPTVREAKISDIPGTLAVSGVIDRAGGRLEQRFAFVALPDGRSVYVDRVQPTEDAGVEDTVLELGTLGVLNDTTWPYHDGSRTLHHADGQHVFEADDARGAAPVELNSPWYNLDNELGIVCLRTNGKQVYHPSPSPARARLEQLFHLNVLPPGKTAAQTALVFYPARSAADTRTAAEECRLEPGKEDGQFTVVLDDGLRLAFDLTELTIQQDQ